MPSLKSVRERGGLAFVIFKFNLAAALWPTAMVIDLFDVSQSGLRSETVLFDFHDE